MLTACLLKLVICLQRHPRVMAGLSSDRSDLNFTLQVDVHPVYMCMTSSQKGRHSPGLRQVMQQVISLLQVPQTHARIIRYATSYEPPYDSMDSAWWALTTGSVLEKQPTCVST